MPLNTAVVDEVNVAVPAAVRNSSSPLAVVIVTEGVPLLDVKLTVAVTVMRPRGLAVPLPEAVIVDEEVKANVPTTVALKWVV